MVLACCFVLLLQGCESSEVSMVKETSLDFDESIPIGKLLESYQYISDPEWNDMETDRGQKIVTFKAKYDVASLYSKFSCPQDFVDDVVDYLEDTPVYLYIEFTIANNQKSFELSYIGLEIDGQIKIERHMNSIVNDLQAIYENRPIMRDLTPEGNSYLFKAELHSAIKNLSLKDAKFIRSFNIDSDNKRFNTYGKVFSSNYILFTIKKLKEKDNEIIATVSYEVTNVEQSHSNMDLERFEEQYKNYKVVDKGEWEFSLILSNDKKSYFSMYDYSQILLQTPGKYNKGELDITINLRDSITISSYLRTLPDEFQKIIDNNEKEQQEKLEKMLSSAKELGVFHIAIEKDLNNYGKLILNYSDAIFETLRHKSLNEPKEIAVYKYSPAYEHLKEYLNNYDPEFILKKFKLFVAENGEIIKVEEIMGDTEYKQANPYFVKEEPYRGNAAKKR